MMFVFCFSFASSSDWAWGQATAGCGFITKPPLAHHEQAKYFDRFGNGYTEEEVSLAHYPNAQRLTCNSGYFSLSFVGTWTSNEQNTVCQVFGDLSNMLIAANPDMPPINILVKKEALGNLYAGLGTPFFEEACGMADSRILDHLNNAFGTSYSLGFLGTIQINSDFLWHTVADDTGTFEDPNNVPSNKLDLYSTTIHEALHVLGFLSRITLDGSPLGGYYTRWDRFLYAVDQNARLLLPLADEDCCNRYQFNNVVFDNMPNDFAAGCDLKIAG